MRLYQLRFLIILIGSILWIQTSLFAQQSDVDTTNLSPDSYLRRGNIVPLTRSSGYLYIDANVDTRPARLLFDTGAYNFYFDSIYYSSNHFVYNKVGVARIIGLGINDRRVRFILDSIDISFNKNVYRTNRIPVVNFKSILGEAVDGVLGIDYFDGKVLRIDFDKNQMEHYSSIDSVDTDGYSVVSITRTGGKLCIPLSLYINEAITIEGLFLLDTGFGGTIILSSPVEKKYEVGKKIKRKAEYYSGYRGVMGESESYHFLARSLTVAGLKLDRFVMEGSLDAEGVMARSDFMGIIGNEVLERFNIILDLKRDLLYIKPSKKFIKRFLIPALGFSYIDMIKLHGGLIVTGLYKESPAEKAGLKVGDLITSINGRNTNEMKVVNFEEIISTSSEIVLGISRDNVKIFVTILPNYIF